MQKRDFKFIKKKGDVSVNFLITLILAVLAFGIILIVYSQFDWAGRVDKETCHQSVIYRATLPSFAGAKEFVPLKCKTGKICFTTGNGKCSEFENSQGITKIKVSNKENIEKAIAGEVIDCWEMMGQGKLSLFNQWFAQTYGLQDVLSSCVICSRIAFDKQNLEKAGIRLNEINVLNYMTNHLIPGKKISYYNYLAGARGKISLKDDNVEKLIEEISNLKGAEKNPVVVNDSNSKTSENEELAVMFMQISAPKYNEVFKNTVYTGLGIGGSAFLMAPVASSKAVTAIGKLALAHPVGAAIAAIIGIGIGGYQAYTVLNNNAIAAGKCGDVAVGDEAKTGCSVVRTVNYNVEDLTKFCSSIESAP